MAEFEFIGRGLKKLFGSRNDRILKELSPLVGRVNAMEPEFDRLTDEQLRAKTTEFRARLEKGETLDDVLAEAFCAVRESSKRALGMRHFDVQVMGGLILHQGKIAEMTTGEGKTLVCTMPAYLNALRGKGVHIVTVNDYLAGRDARWMRPVFTALGMTVSSIRSRMPQAERLAAYRADITWGTNSEFGFDYLRDNMKLRLDDQTQQGMHCYAIVDEVDSILIDEARTPLIIAGAAEQSAEQYYIADRVVKQLEADVHYEVNEKDHRVVLTEDGIDRSQELAGVGSFYDAKNITWPHHIDQALKANYLYKKDVNYVVDDTDEGVEIVIVDEFTGRKMRGRRWSDGLHQAVEAKEGLQIREENQTLATITYQNFFRLYEKLAGMTGTAVTEAAEFLKIYNLDVLIVPTNRPLRRARAEDLIYRTEGEKYDAVMREIVDVHETGRPILIGTTSVEKSERLAKLLDGVGITYELLNAKQHEREAHIVANAGQPGAVTIATNMAGRGTDIILGHDVAKQGGLHVVGTERHEARRIDNQLRGRAGRQGDPGSSQFFLSLEDDLMRIFAKDWVGTMLQKLGMEDGQEIQSPMVTRMIERVQKKMEAHNFDIRKNLLEYDAVNNEQRKVVYGWRQAILEGRDQMDRVMWALQGVCERATPTYLITEDREAQPDVDGLVLAFGQRFGDGLVKGSELEGLSVPEAVELLSERANGAYLKRREGYGEARMKPLERYLLLQTIDDKWKDHLQALDYLRTGVGMRGYGQEDPKIVYRREAAMYFEEMISAIREQVADLVFHVEPPEHDAPDPVAARRAPALPVDGFDEDDWGPADDDTDWEAVLEEQRQEAARARESAPPTASLSGGPATGGTATLSAPAGSYRARQQSARPPDRPAGDPLFSKKKAKPNDPCPCGSGRKYKKCHGG